MRQGLKNVNCIKKSKDYLEATGSMIGNKKQKPHPRRGNPRATHQKKIRLNSEKKFGLKTRKIKVNRKEYHNREQFPR